MDSLPITEIIRLREEGIKRLLAEKSHLEEELANLSTRIKTVNEQLMQLGHLSNETEKDPRARSSNRGLNKRTALRSRNDHTIEQHLEGKKTPLIELFYSVHQHILNLGGEIQITSLKNFIRYSLDRNFCEIVVWASKLQIYIYISLTELNDPKNIAEDCSNVGHWANANTRFILDSQSDIDYAMSLILQAYQKQIQS
jgi:predicted transport protein